MTFLWRGIRNYQANKASCRLGAASRKPQERKKKSKTRDGKARLEDQIAVVSELLGTNVMHIVSLIGNPTERSMARVSLGMHAQPRTVGDG